MSKPDRKPSLIEPTQSWPQGFYCDYCGEPATRLRLMNGDLQWFNASCEIHKEIIEYD